MRAAAVVAAATAALALAPWAFGHGSVQPTVAAPGATEVFTFLVQNGRDEAMLGFGLLPPEGATVVRAAAKTGWRVRQAGNLVEWHGGRVPPRGSASFQLRARMPATEGTVAFTGLEIFRNAPGPPFRFDVVLAGGRSGESDGETSRTPIFLALAAGLVLVALALAARRRRAR